MIKKWLIYSILASILWAIVSPFIKIGISYGIGPMNFAGLRFTLAGFILLLVSTRLDRIKLAKENFKFFLLLIILNTTLGYATFYIGVDMVDSTISSIVAGMAPLINAILSHIMTKHDKLTKHKIISIIFSLVGLIFITGIGNSSNSIGIKGIIGILFIFANIILQGYCAIRISQYEIKIDPLFLNGFQMFFGGILLYVIGIFSEGFYNPFGRDLTFYTSLTILVFISVFAFSLWFMALQCEDVKVSEMNMCRLLNPILGSILSWILIKNEHPTINTIVGMTIIISSLFYYFKKTQKDTVKKII